MNFGIMDFVIPLCVALAFLGLGRLWLLAVRKGQPLTPFMKGALLYGSLFVLGLGYLLMFGGNLNWPQTFVVLNGRTLGVALHYSHGGFIKDGSIVHGNSRKQREVL